MVKNVESPEKELRFTRAHQSIAFWILGALCVAGGVTVLVTAMYRGVNPDLPHPLWALIPFLLAVLVLRLAIHMTRHACLILTPLGLEIFPLWKPQDTMRVVFWYEVAAVDFDDALKTMTVHYDAEKTAGVHLSLRPIPKHQRALLAKAMRARVGDNEATK